MTLNLGLKALLVSWLILVYFSVLTMYICYGSGDDSKLQDMIKELLPVASNWKILGGLMGVQKHVLDKIDQDKNGVYNKLQEMLSEWLKQIDPPPTWTLIADALSYLDAARAERIRRLYVEDLTHCYMKQSTV